MARGSESWESTLNAGDEAEARARFLHLATAELDRAYRLAGLLLGDRAEAEDATQEALVRAWRGIGRLREAQGFQAWFDRILVNVCRDHLRRRRRIRFIPLDAIAEASVVSDPFRAVLDRDEILQALASLGDDERLVVVLHYWADLTLASIAERAGWRLGTVKSRLHRALGRMAADLQVDPADAPRARP